MTPPAVAIAWQTPNPRAIVGVVVAEDVTIGPADDALTALLDAALATGDGGGDDAVKLGIRDLLRAGGYKPSGRNKPASEYLSGAAAREAFPRINNVVDVNNLLSLETGWPMSALDLDRALGDAAGLAIRDGEPGETYVFNSTGQEIALAGLLGVARLAGAMVGNPVKDAMVAKTDDATRRLIALLWSSDAVADPARVLAVAARYAQLLTAHAGASATATWVLPA